MKSRDSTMRNLTMQRRHFQLIADTIKGLPIIVAPGNEVDARKVVALEFAKALAATNPGFDKTRFMEACGAYES